MDSQAQAKALRLRLYVLCSECARIIDLSEGNKPQRMIEAADLIRHEAEEHAARLTTDKKSTHFVQPVKEPIEEKKE